MPLVVPSFIQSAGLTPRYALLITHPSKEDHGKCWASLSIPSGPALNTCVNMSGVAQDPGNCALVVEDGVIEGSVNPHCLECLG